MFPSLLLFMVMIIPEVERACRLWLEHVVDEDARKSMERDLFHQGLESNIQTGAFIHLYTHEWLSKAGYTLDVPEPPDLLVSRDDQPLFYVEVTHRSPSAVVEDHLDEKLWEEGVPAEIPDRRVVLECLEKKQSKYMNLDLPLLLVIGLAYRPYDITEAEDDLKYWFRELNRTEGGDARLQPQFSGFLIAHPISPFATFIPKVWFTHHDFAKHPLEDDFIELAGSFSEVTKDYLGT